MTLYPYVDLNNIWTIHKATVLYNTSQPLEYVRNGDHIRLEHFSSSRKLHSHDERPQLTNRKEHHEVTYVFLLNHLDALPYSFFFLVWIVPMAID